MNEKCKQPGCCGDLVDQIRARFGDIPYFSLDDVNRGGRTIEETWEMIQRTTIEHNLATVLAGGDMLGPNPCFISIPYGEMYAVHLVSDSPEFVALCEKERKD